MVYDFQINITLQGHLLGLIWYMVYKLQRNSDSTHLDVVLKWKRHVATQPRGRPRCADGVALFRVVVPDRRASTDVADASCCLRQRTRALLLRRYVVFLLCN